jgi:molybdenum cofactor synthesis domain-containing protein
LRAVILAIGREILRGRTQDSNSWTLARRLTGIGYALMRIVACDDHRAEIAREIRRAVEDGAGVLITTGGLGPTDDDLTLQALAEATGHPLALDEAASAQVAARYAELHRAGAVDDPAMTPAREKMAWIPQGARALANPVGAAPGVWLEVGGVTFVSLPGVPAEMTAILEGAVLPKLSERGPGAVYVERRWPTGGRDESALAPILRRITTLLPEVFLKSHPTRFGKDVAIQVFASTWAPDQRTAEDRLARAHALLREGLGEAPPPANDQ